MIVRLVAQYSHRDGLAAISRRHPNLLAEIRGVIITAGDTDFEPERYVAYGKPFDRSPVLGEALRRGLFTKGWTELLVSCEPSSVARPGRSKAQQYFLDGFRELDAVKCGLGVEIQFGKPPLPVCSICAKMTIFHNLGHIDCGIEIVPVKALALEMSSGVSYFEQFVWDLRHRGVADIDIPVLILGIDA
jgi:hypothetical protein